MHAQIQGSEYQTNQTILNSSQSTEASGLNLFPSAYMSKGVGGKRSNKKNKKTYKKKGGDCGCTKLFKGGKKSKKSNKKR